MLLSLLLWACDSDVSIIKRIDDTDTSNPIVEPSAVPSSEPGYDPQRVGISGYTFWDLTQVACPACVGESQEMRVKFSANFHEPTSDGWTEWIIPEGVCDDQLINITPSTIPLSVGSQVQVNNPSHQFVANQLGGGYYENTSIWEPQIQRDSQYDVITEMGNYSFYSSHGFDWIEPYTMLWVDPSYAFEAPIYRSGASFSWAPTSTNHTFNITVAVYSPDGSQLLGYVTCGGPDNGFMQIPGQYLQGYPYGGLVAIHMVRHKVDLVETDINNSYIETHTQWQVIGTGHIE